MITSVQTASSGVSQRIAMWERRNGNDTQTTKTPTRTATGGRKGIDVVGVEVKDMDTDRDSRPVEKETVTHKKTGLISPSKERLVSPFPSLEGVFDDPLNARLGGEEASPTSLEYAFDDPQMKEPEEEASPSASLDYVFDNPLEARLGAEEASPTSLEFAFDLQFELMNSMPYAKFQQLSNYIKQLEHQASRREPQVWAMDDSGGGDDDHEDVQALYDALSPKKPRSGRSQSATATWQQHEDADVPPPPSPATPRRSMMEFVTIRENEMMCDEESPVPSTLPPCSKCGTQCKWRTMSMTTGSGRTSRSLSEFSSRQSSPRRFLEEDLQCFSLRHAVVKRMVPRSRLLSVALLAVFFLGALYCRCAFVPAPAAASQIRTEQYLRGAATSGAFFAASAAPAFAESMDSAEVYNRKILTAGSYALIPTFFLFGLLISQARKLVENKWLL